MYVKALKKGMFDLARNGTFVDIKKDQVFEVPDDLVIKPTSWLVRCDKQGNLLDPAAARKEAEKARAKATKEAEDARIATEKAKREQAEAAKAEARAKELEEKAAAEAAAKANPPAK